MQDSQITWTQASDLTDSVLGECATLFSTHYGIWGASTPKKAGKPITLPADTLKALYLRAPESWAALVHLNSELIGYAFFQRLYLKGKGYVTWVTQFVVHKEHQNQGLGTRILRSIWSQSDQYAWGLVTANPAAVRALEKATLRRCDPVLINENWPSLQELAGPNLQYIAGASKSTQEGSTAVDTNFSLDRTESNATMAKLVERGYDWRLGYLKPEEEWAAFTFSGQEYSDQAHTLVGEWIADCDVTVFEAYEGMALDANHKWQQQTKHEIDFFLNSIGSKSSAKILDIGCGTGRHSIELASRGYEVVGIDSGQKLVAIARQSSTSANVNVQFEYRDARRWVPNEKFDHVICLYDVVGSFADDSENAKIVRAAYASLNPRGFFLLSVMNGELMDAIAQHCTDYENLHKDLLALEPSPTMQETGNIFAPQHVLWHREASIAYRREQFQSKTVAPCEMVVRDRRYSAQQIRDLCQDAGFEVISAQYSKMGHWHEPAEPTDPAAKEIIVLCRKP